MHHMCPYQPFKRARAIHSVVRRQELCFNFTWAAWGNPLALSLPCTFRELLSNPNVRRQVVTVYRLPEGGAAPKGPLSGGTRVPVKEEAYSLRPGSQACS